MLRTAAASRRHSAAGESRRRHSITWTPAVVVAYTLVSAVVFLDWVGLDRYLSARHQSLNLFGEARVVDMIHGTAHRPFVTRTLLPSTALLLRAAVPERLQRKLEKRLDHKPRRVLHALESLGIGREYALECLIALGLAFACFLGFAFALRRLFLGVYESPPIVADAAPVLALSLLPPVFFGTGTHYLYDPPTLLLWTLSLDCLLRRSFRAFHLLFLLGSFNRETTVLLTVVFLANEWRRTDRKSLLTSVMTQVGLFGVSRLVLAELFRDNPGATAHLNWAKNLYLMQHATSAVSVTAFAMVVFLVLHRFRRKHPFLRRSLVLVPPLVVGYVLFGIYGEVRVFYEAFPVVFLTALHALVDLAGGKVMRPRSDVDARVTTA